MRAGDEAGFRRTLLDIYLPRYGEAWEQFLDEQTVYARFVARRVFTLRGDATA